MKCLIFPPPSTRSDLREKLSPEAMAWPGLSEASPAHLCQLSFLIIKVLFGTLSQLASQAITTLCAKRKGFKNKFFLTKKDVTDEVTNNGSRGLDKMRDRPSVLDYKQRRTYLAAVADCAYGNVLR